MSDRTESAGEIDFNEGDLPDDLSGRWIGQFQLLAPVGSGGSASVYEGIDSASGNRVAVKVLNLHASGRLESADRFLDEVRLSRALDHPNLLLPFDGGVYRRRAYLVSRFVEATSLSELITRSGPLETGDLESLARHTSSALDALHGHGIIHRDVKPSNILVVGGPKARQFLLTDLGIGQGPRVEKAEGAGASRVGTGGYSAPEQLSGVAVDRRADVFSLGCVLYEAATGAPAFPWDPTARGERRSEAVPVSELRAGAPTGLDATIARAMSHQARDRYRSAGRLGDAVSRSLRPANSEAAERGSKPAPPPTPDRRNHPVDQGKVDDGSGELAERTDKPVYLRYALTPAASYLRKRETGATIVRMKRWAFVTMAISALAGFALALTAVLGGDQRLALVAVGPLTVCIYIQTRRPTESAFSAARAPAECELEASRAIAAQPNWAPSGTAGKLVGPAGPVNTLALVILVLAGLLPGLAYLAARKGSSRISVRSRASEGFSVVNLSGSGEAAQHLLEEMTVRLATSLSS